MSVCGLLVSILLVSGCGWGGGARYPARYEIIPKTEIIAVESGTINVPPPNGFCKDTTSSTNSESAAILIFGNCGFLNSNGRRAAGHAGFSGIVTTSISKAPTFQDNDNIDTLADFLNSHEGLSALSVSGQAETISIVSTQSAMDAIYMQYRDTDAALSQNIWKSFLNRSDHLVTVTLLQNNKPSMSPAQIMAFLQGYSETIKLSASPARPTVDIRTVQDFNPAEHAQPEKQVPQLKKVGFLRRLLF